MPQSMFALGHCTLPLLNDIPDIPLMFDHDAADDVKVSVSASDGVAVPDPNTIANDAGALPLLEVAGGGAAVP